MTFARAAYLSRVFFMVKLKVPLHAAWQTRAGKLATLTCTHKLHFTRVTELACTALQARALVCTAPHARVCTALHTC